MVILLKKWTERPKSCQRIRGGLLLENAKAYDRLETHFDGLRTAERKQFLLLCYSRYLFEISSCECFSIFFLTNSVHLRVLEKCQSQVGHFSPPLPCSTRPQTLVGAEGQTQGLSRVRQMSYHRVTSEVLASSVLKCSHNTFQLCKRLKEKIRVHH